MFKENVWTLREQLTLYRRCLKWHVFVQWSEENKERDWLSSFKKKRGSGSSSLWMRLYAPWAGVHFQICNLSIIKQWAAHIDAYLPKCVTQFPKQQLHLNILSRKKRKSQTHEISAHQTEVWYKYDKRGSDKKKTRRRRKLDFFYFDSPIPISRRRRLSSPALYSSMQIIPAECRYLGLFVMVEVYHSVRLRRAAWHELMMNAAGRDRGSERERPDSCKRGDTETDRRGENERVGD